MIFITRSARPVLEFIMSRAITKVRRSAQQLCKCLTIHYSSLSLVICRLASLDLRISTSDLEELLNDGATPNVTGAYSY
jgi:hypothetical protein